MARRLGVTPPTVGRMLHADQAGADGVAIRHWFGALNEIGLLEPLVSRFEELLCVRDPEFKARAVTEDNVIDDALLRIGYTLREAILSSPIRSARQLSLAVGITQPTLATLLTAKGPHVGGTGIGHMVRIANALGLGCVFWEVLPPPRRLYEPPSNTLALAGPRF